MGTFSVDFASYMPKVHVCLYVCVSVRQHISGTARPIFKNVRAYYSWAWLGPPQSGGVAIGYVFLVLSIRSYLHVIGHREAYRYRCIGLTFSCIVLVASCPSRRRASRPDESFVQAESAMHPMHSGALSWLQMTAVTGCGRHTRVSTACLTSPAASPAPPPPCWRSTRRATGATTRASPTSATFPSRPTATSTSSSCSTAHALDDAAARSTSASPGSPTRAATQSSSLYPTAASQVLHRG